MMETIMGAKYALLFVGSGLEMFELFCLLAAVAGFLCGSWDESKSKKNIRSVLFALWFLVLGGLILSWGTLLFNGNYNHRYAIPVVAFFSIVFWVLGSFIGRMITRLIIRISLIFTTDKREEVDLKGSTDDFPHGPWMDHAQ